MKVILSASYQKFILIIFPIFQTCEVIILFRIIIFEKNLEYIQQFYFFFKKFSIMKNILLNNLNNAYLLIKTKIYSYY